MSVLVVLPSYNERENIVPITEAILAQRPDVRVCIVDDSSPDGTAAAVREAIAARPGWTSRVHLIARAGKYGRGSAVRDGFAWGLESGEPFDAFVEMDCDFSHEPGALGEGLALLQAGNDMVIGARYPRGTIIGWPRSRRVFSFFANLLARGLIDWSIHDYTNGFRFYSADAVRAVLAHPQKHPGFMYLSESLAHLLSQQRRVAAFPIRFVNRARGESNVTRAEILAALRGIFAVAWNYRFARWRSARASPAPEERSRAMPSTHPGTGSRRP